MNHTRKQCEDSECDGMCNVCELFWCSVCWGAEGSLPTDCPSARMSESTEDSVFAGELDFREDRGGWFTVME